MGRYEDEDEIPRRAQDLREEKDAYIDSLSPGLERDLEVLRVHHLDSLRSIRAQLERVEYESLKRGSKISREDVVSERAQADRQMAHEKKIYEIACKLVMLEYGWWTYYPEDFYHKQSDLQKQLKELKDTHM